MSTDKLQILSKTNQHIINQRHRAITESMQKLGMKLLGEGAFGSVFQSKDYDHVIKIFVTDDCYVSFLKLVADHPNVVNFPKIIKYAKFKSDKFRGLHIVKMERLSPIKEDEFDDLESEMEVAVGVSNKKTSKMFTSPSYTKFLNHLKTSNKSLFEACTLIGKALEKTKCGLDLHKGNVMKRGEVIVIIDPYAG